MYLLRLYDEHNPLQPIDARLLREGQVSIGRDPTADWVMNDPDCGISRWHCVFIAQDNGLALCCTGTNGVFDGDTGRRLPDDQTVPVSLPSRFQFGPYRLVADYAPQAGAHGADDGQTLILSPPLGASIDTPNDYTDATDGHAVITDGSLLDAFCEGAGLDVSSFALEDPGDVMRRAGAVYRQMVLGVGDLMAERDATRRRYQMARTTIGGANNNPFKWAPTQRLALDLLLAEGRGFLSGPAALKSSFRDIKRHLLATFGGLHESLKTAVNMFEPTAIESATEAQKSLLKSRSAANWEECCRRHAVLQRQVGGDEDGLLNEVFVKAYDVTATELEGGAA